MIAKMEIKKTSNGIELRTGLLESLRDNEFYLSGKIKEDLAERLHVLLGNLSQVDIHQVDGSGLIKTRPHTVHDLHVIELKDARNSILRSLFLQIFSSANLHEDAQQYRERRRKIENRERHIQYWNKLEFPTPFLLTVEKRESRDTGDYAYGIISDYWDGNSHDEDLMAINFRALMVAHHLSNEFVNPLEKIRLQKELEELKVLKAKIASSVLDTQHEVAVKGTDNIILAGDRLVMGMPTRDFEYYKWKILDNFRFAFKWHCRVDPKPELKGKNRRQELTDRFEEYIVPIVRILADDNKKVYAHGDEFFHNFKYRSILGKRRSGMFDSDHACMNRLELSRAKTLLSPLLDADYESIDRYLTAANERLLINLHQADSEATVKDRLSHLVLPQAVGSTLESDLIEVYEAINIIGRIAEGDLNNTKHIIQRADTTINYSNPHIDFPSAKPGAIPLGMFSSRSDVYKLRGRLDERLSRMIEGNTPYGRINDRVLLESLKGLQGILAYFTIPDHNGKIEPFFN